MQPWIIPSLKQVVRDLDGIDATDFVHVSTVACQSSDIDAPATGHAVWMASFDGQPAAIAWEWVVLSHGSVAMTDPLAVVTNIGFAHGDGTIIDASKAALKLNRIVHELPWQAKALRAFRAARRVDGRATSVRPWARRNNPVAMPLMA